MEVTVSGWVHAAEQESLPKGGIKTCVHNDSVTSAQHQTSRFAPVGGL